ncbi:HAD family phosphatase [Erythrobacter sp.]|uniref:HAD family hydrolase n=1 Tax=Erythrobacter sp. TaxID=1042 RepID=UPI0025B7CB77|nr:beta-phosphoglucomutase family hydrolase [Erythrobacter sp.]
MHLSPARLDAAIFDLDGVLTDTASLHEAAWKETFDAFLRTWDDRQPPFGPDDYQLYVDGRRREEGVRTFLASRGIKLPEGAQDDPPGAETVMGLSRRKNEAVQERLRTASRALPGAERLLRDLRTSGIAIAVASSSANARQVLEATGLAHHVQARVDGIDASRLDLPGKPHPALFEEALRRLGVKAERAVIFEDAIAGVEAGRRAGFARVIGVGPNARADALREAGADEVVGDLSGVTVG